MKTKICPLCKEFYSDKARFCQYDAQPLEEYKEEEQYLGTILDGKYLINAFLSKGSTGNVFTAIHLFMQITVAIKILHEHRSKDDQTVTRFRREAQSANSVKHPNLVTMMDFGITPEKVFYLVMEFIEGISLAEIIKSTKGIDWVRACKLMKQICAGLNAVHNKNIIHRDLKPRNILVEHYETKDECVKIIGFSLAKNYLEKGGDLSPTTTTVDSLEPNYISPEQAEGLALDPRSDIYSLGLIFYEMLTGEPPFTGATASAIISQHLMERPRPLRELNPEIPAKLETMVMKALSKQPYDRQSSVISFAAEIDHALAQARGKQVRG